MSKFLDVLEQLKMYKNFDTLEQVQKLGLEHLSLQHCVHWASYLKIMYYSPYIQEKKIHTSAGFEFSACISKNGLPNQINKPKIDKLYSISSMHNLL